MYTSKEVSEITKLDNETIRRYLVAGKIKGVKMGRVWRVEEQELQKFMKGE